MLAFADGRGGAALHHLAGTAAFGLVRGQGTLHRGGTLVLTHARGTFPFGPASGTIGVIRASGTVDISRACGTVDISRASGTVDVSRASGTVDVGHAREAIRLAHLHTPVVHPAVLLPADRGTVSAVAAPGIRRALAGPLLLSLAARLGLLLTGLPPLHGALHHALRTLRTQSRLAGRIPEAPEVLQPSHVH
ncbi:hypothetical protein [Streptomyces sp. NPDC058335]|uniref:hypothetical protein n=1 Tax=Streptomyces sp. NPDC058335 TaxID=3346451 RepID=UPI003666E17F